MPGGARPYKSKIRKLLEPQSPSDGEFAGSGFTLPSQLVPCLVRRQHEQHAGPYCHVVEWQYGPAGEDGLSPASWAVSLTSYWRQSRTRFPAQAA